MKSFIESKAVFIFLLPVFFVFHGFVEHYNFVPVQDAFLLALLYTVCTLITIGICWLVYHDFNKATFLSFFIMSFFFFFGSIQDFLRSHFSGRFFSRYSFILSLFFLFFVGLTIWLKRKKDSLKKFTFYLNLLFIVFLIIDFIWLSEKIITGQKRSPFKPSIDNLFLCDTCKKPDVFFIILDEYSGRAGLRTLFNFDNDEFEKQLRQRGFSVAKDSRSNYNYTPFSIASILNMNYLDLNMEKKAPGNIDYCYRQIKNSRVINYFIANGYEFYNYSIFDFEGRPAISYDNFLPNSTTLITAQTFFSRIMKDISYNISTGKWKLKLGLQKRTYEHLHSNENILRLTKFAASRKIIKPKFVYAHLMMPHYPYYFNSKGEAQVIQKLLPGQESDRDNYIEYLQYCNQQILGLVDRIISVSDKPPVIMLLGDHGFREGIKKEEHKDVFMNLNAVYLPDKNYSRFYDSISNVNQFRVLLNTEFKQHLSLLRDSTIFLWDEND